jgi:hypothetical protein
MLHRQAVKHKLGINLYMASGIYSTTRNKIVGGVSKATGRINGEAWAAADVEVVTLSYGARVQRTANHNYYLKCHRD